VGFIWEAQTESNEVDQTQQPGDFSQKQSTYQTELTTDTPILYPKSQGGTEGVAIPADLLRSEQFRFFMLPHNDDSHPVPTPQNTENMFNSLRSLSPSISSRRAKYRPYHSPRIGKAQPNTTGNLFRIDQSPICHHVPHNRNVCSCEALARIQSQAQMEHPSELLANSLIGQGQGHLSQGSPVPAQSIQQIQHPTFFAQQQPLCPVPEPNQVFLPDTPTLLDTIPLPSPAVAYFSSSPSVSHARLNGFFHSEDVHADAPMCRNLFAAEADRKESRDYTTPYDDTFKSER